LFFRIAAAVPETIIKSITPTGMRNTALEINNLVEIFNREKNILYTLPEGLPGKKWLPLARHAIITGIPGHS
jgi:hypothetical protein